MPVGVGGGNYSVLDIVSSIWFGLIYHDEEMKPY
jgi:hypothetical protein